MVRINIPGQFRSAAAGRPNVDLRGETVAEILGALCRMFPDLREKIFDSDGEKRKAVNVYLNEEDIRYIDGLASTVADSDEIIILPPISGG